MKFSTLLKNPAQWMEEVGPEGDIVMTSRVRLARNLTGHPFPGWAKKENRIETMGELKERVEALPVMKDAFSEELSKLTAIRKQVLVERHLISREQAAKGAGSAAIMNRTQTVSVMVNEEDHLRMQAIQSGLNLEEAYRVLNEVDVLLEEVIDYAFDRKLGYLTACPTNLGTGMRASAMLHLPALVLTGQVNKVIQAVNKIGLAVRGLYGEGTEALANLFQVSNQSTLGIPEPDIIAQLQKVIRQIISSERNARLKLLEDEPEKLYDQVGRAYALLRFSYNMESKEALNLLSMLRLGSDMGILPKDQGKMIDGLIMEIQPAHLQISKEKLAAEQRDVLRSEILRAKLKTMPEPDKLLREDDSC